MARNIEIKAEAPDPSGLESRVREAASDGPSVIEQDDTFFNCPSGRLKLRQFSPESGELIFYVRDDVAGPKTSHYVRSPTGAPDSLRDALQQAYGITGRVRKQRKLFLIGRTRVHLDDVDGLGHFVELEVVLEDGEDLEAGIAEANSLMDQLGIAPDSLVEGAYLDLLRLRDAPVVADIEPDPVSRPPLSVIAGQPTGHASTSCYAVHGLAHERDVHER